MKKLLSVLLVMVMSLSVLAGCGGSKETQNLSGIDLEKYVTKLGEYKGLEITGVKTEITDEYVDSYIEYMLIKSPVVQDTDRTVIQDGDLVNIDFVGKDKDGVEFQGGSAQGYDLEIGSGTFIPGFEDALIGGELGTTFDIDVTFPEEYGNEELAGQPAVFTVTINKISEFTTPELTDEFIQGLGYDEYTTVEDFKEICRQSLEANAESVFQSELQTAVMDALMVECEFSEEIPDALYDYYRDNIDQNIANSASMVGIDKMQYVLENYGMSEQQYEYELDNGASRSTKQALVCGLIAKKEGIVVTDEELDAAIAENYANFGYQSVEDYKEKANVEDYRDNLLITKVLNFLIDNANITQLTEEEAAALKAQQAGEATTEETTIEETTEAATTEAATE